MLFRAMVRTDIIGDDDGDESDQKASLVARKSNFISCLVLILREASTVSSVQYNYNALVADTIRLLLLLTSGKNGS